MHDDGAGAMLHENLARGEDLARPTERRFGLTIGAVLAFVAAFRWLFGRSHPELWLAAGIVFAAFAVLWPAALSPLNRIWFKFGLVLSKVVNPIVMTVLYVVTIVPIGVALRLSGKDLLRLKPRPEAESYWIAHEPPRPAAEAMKNQF